MLSVGCDFGLRKSGIVVLNDKYEILSQNLVQVPPTVKGAPRLAAIRQGFSSIVEPFLGEDLDVFVEGYAYGAKYQRESLAELGGVMRVFLYETELDYWIIPPTSLKFFVTGTGKASKNYMKKCTKDKWEQSFKSDDVCDGYGLARLGMNVMKLDRGIQGLNHFDPDEAGQVKEIFLHQDYYKNSNTARKRPSKSK